MMATDSDVSISQIDTQFDRLSVASEECSFRSYVDAEISQVDEEYLRNWGFNLKDLYRLALRFYKEKEGKAVNLSYPDKLKMVALTRQVSVGRFNPDRSPPLGVLDVIGRDRRVAWQSLGDMSAEEAMKQFIELLDSSCVLFRPFVQAHQADVESRTRLIMLAEERKRKEEEKLRELDENTNVKDYGERKISEVQKRQIQEALNQQTYPQFKAYVEQHFPNDPIQQEKLLRELQAEHYNQYMEQLGVERRRGVEEAALQTGGAAVVAPPGGGFCATAPPLSNGIAPHSNGDEQQQLSMYHQQYSTDSEGGIPSVIPAASMWTAKDVKEFKESIRNEGGDSIIRVGHGETVTVRVPTNEEGSCLFWEFATDYYDIGFGVYFEWTKSPTSQVSVHVSESEDEDDFQGEDDDDDEEEDEELARYREDVERGAGGGGARTLDLSAAGRPAISVIVPVYRRDAHERVYAGSHPYPGVGVYLLKFDNSYSLWRSKTLYYRVYYTR